MKRSVNQIIRTMEGTGIMMEHLMTPAAQRQGLIDYEHMVQKLVFNDEHAEEMHIQNVADHFRDLAAEKGYEEDPTVLQAIEDMDMIGKNIAISISGAQGERMVNQQLRYVRRNIITLSNLNISGDGEKTELDQVVITSNGVIILEVKNYKHNITITESGQIYGDNHQKYTQKVLGEQMNTKRYLLRTKLDEKLKEDGLSIHVNVQSKVVFTNSDITVTDLYKQEPYCFKARVSHDIDNFSSRSFYSSAQMDAIAKALKAIAEPDAVYDVAMDFDRIRHNFAKALVMLEGDPKEVAEQSNIISCSEKSIQEQANDKAPEVLSATHMRMMPNHLKACACILGISSVATILAATVCAFTIKK